MSKREIQIIQRRYESKYFPLVKKAIQSKIDDVIMIVRLGGAEDGISFLNKQLANTKLTEIIQTMALEVGLRFARMESAKLPKQKSFQHETKGLKDWADWIRNYLFDFIVEKISFSVFETTKEVLFTVLNNAIKGGWGIDKTVQALDELPLSTSQASRIVRTEITRATNAGVSAAAETYPYKTKKQWISAHDTRVRGFNPKDHASHIGLDGQVIDSEDLFQDPRNGQFLRWPGDPKAPPGDTVNCRCHIATIAKRDSKGNLIPKSRISVIMPGEFNRTRTIVTI